MLKSRKIEIQDVSISAILEQYLAYLDEMKRMDVEIASEFTAMASHLMLIKTKMLLSAAEQEEAMSEMELLIQSLEQRQRKQAYEALAPAFANIVPALFGALAVVYVSKNAKIAIAPMIFMLALFISVPSLASSVGIFVPVGALIAIGASRILYKKGKL